MMKRNLVIAVTLVMMGMNVMAQDNLLGIDMDNVEVVRVGGSASASATTTTAPTRTVSVRQLAAASARRSSGTTVRRATTSTTAYANQTAQNDLQSQLQAVAASSNQQVVVCGIVRGCTPCGTGMRKMVVESDGMFGTTREYTLVGYQYPTIKIVKGDHICFIATDNGSYSYPMVNYSEVINSTGMVRYMNEYQRHHIGLGTSPYAGKMSTWGKVINGVNTGLYLGMSAVAFWQLLKTVF